jgi:hypothetical protein
MRKQNVNPTGERLASWNPAPAEGVPHEHGEKVAVHVQDRGDFLKV